MQVVTMGNSLKNDEWISEEGVADPEILPEIPGYHILVRPVSVKEKTKGGIFIPDSTKNDIAYLTTVGKVLKVGDSASYKGYKLILLFDDQISMIVGDPKELDPTFNLSN